MREVESVVCPGCLEFLGNIDKLDECPLCGYELKIKEKVKKNEEEN